MIFVFSLVSAALLCIASFICYKLSGKMLDEKDAEKNAQRKRNSKKKLIDLMMQKKTSRCRTMNSVSAVLMRHWSWGESVKSSWRM